MKTPQADQTSGRQLAKSLKIAVAILGFAFLMGVRDEFAQWWIRALIAGVAAAFLVVVVSMSQRQS